MARRKPKSTKKATQKSRTRTASEKSASESDAMAAAAGAAAADAASADTASADAADAWLTCVAYELVVDRTEETFTFRFSAWDSDGQRHGLELRSEADRPALAQDLFDALQIWPDVKIQFKSKAKPNASYPIITEIKRVHPRT